MLLERLPYGLGVVAGLHLGTSSRETIALATAAETGHNGRFTEAAENCYAPRDALLFERTIMTLNFGKPLLSLALSAFLLFTPSAANAGGADEKGIDAQALIDACWAISLEDRSSGVTARHREGALNSVLCLEEVILDQVDVLFPDGEYLSREQAAEKLERLRFAAGSLYWSIYNGNIACDPSCGTIWHTAHLSANARILEDMIRNIVYVRNYHRF